MIRSITFVVVLCAPLRAAEPLPDGAIARLEKLRSAVAADQIAFTPDRQLLVAINDRRAFVWDAKTGKYVREFTIDANLVVYQAPLRDGTLFTLDSHGVVRWYDLRSGTRLATRDLGRDLNAIEQLALGNLGWRPDPVSESSLLFLRHYPRANLDQQSVRVYRLDLDSGRLRFLREAAGVHMVQGIAPDGRLYLRSEERPTLNDVARLYSDPTGVRIFVAALDTGRPLFDLRHEDALLVAKGFSPDGQTILSCTNTKSPTADGRCAVHLWETRSGRARHTFRLPRTRDYEYLAFTPDGGRIIADMRDDRLLILDAQSGRELGRLAMPGIGKVVLDYRVLTMSSDGKAMVTWHGDGSFVVWDLSRFAPLAGQPLDRAGLEARWAVLAETDASKAHVAIGELIGAGRPAVELLAARLKPATPPPAERVRQWIADLNDNRFERRRAAEQMLLRHLDLVQDELRAAAAASTAPEQRKRLESLLSQAPPVATDPEELRALRAAEVLEHVGTPEARRALELLTTGASAARLTRDAHSALQRLK